VPDEIGYVKGSLPGWGDLVDEATEKNPALRWPESIEVYDQMRREDAQVGSVLRAVTMPIRSARWEIDPAGARDEVVRMVAEDLGLPVKGQESAPRPRRERGKFSWDDFLRLALLELVFGHSVFEQVYRIEDGRARLGKLAWRPPRTIAKFDVAKDGGLVAVEQHGAFGITTVRIPVDRLVVFVNDREGANWIGQSLLRQAYKPWALKDKLLRIETMVADRNGLGVPVYEGAPLPDAIAKDTAKAEQWLADQRDEGLRLAKEFRAGEASGAYIPAGAKLTLQGVQGKLPDLNTPIRRHDEQIARAVLANFLTLGGDDSTGSYALGDTFVDFFTGALNAISKHFGDITQQHVVEDLVDLNWGPDEVAPRLVPPQLGKDAPLTAEGVRALIDCGAFTADAELEKFLRARYGLPAPAEVPSDASDDDSTTSDAERARFAAETIQKVYLGVGTVVDKDEARAIARRAGADLKEDA